MYNFEYALNTKVFFGKGSIRQLIGEITTYGKKALIVTGVDSVKKNGVFDVLTDILGNCGITYVELTGIKHNPDIRMVREGLQIARESRVEMIIGAGGGSVIDCAKAIACAYHYDGDPWDIQIEPSKIGRTLPVVAIITLSATGSELNGNYVITNKATCDKIGVLHCSAIPKIAIMDPEYTISVSKYQSAAGTTDIFAHAVEGYFNHDTCEITDGVSEAVMRTCLKYGETVIDEPDNYEARANLMWAGALAMNQLTRVGRKIKGFSSSCHIMQHQLAAYYDINHGMCLGVLMPAWMGYILSKHTAYRFERMAKRVFDVPADIPQMEAAKLSIELLKRFLLGMGVPLSLDLLGIVDDSQFDIIAKKCAPTLKNSFVPLNIQDVKNILYSCLYQGK